MINIAKQTIPIPLFMYNLQTTYNCLTAKPCSFVSAHKILSLTYVNDLNFVLFFSSAKKIKQHAFFAFRPLYHCQQLLSIPYRALYCYTKNIWQQYRALYCYSSVFSQPKSTLQSYSQHFEKQYGGTKAYSKVLEVPYRGTKTYSKDLAKQYRGTKTSSKSSEHTYGHQYTYSKTILPLQRGLYGGSKYILQETLIKDK